LFEASRVARENLVKQGLRPNLGSHLYLRGQNQQQPQPGNGP
jgi:hypothetical protein